MRFTKLTWRNLFSYGDYDNEVALDQDGIVFVRGVNKGDDTSNGSGKCVDAKTKIITRCSIENVKKLLTESEFKEYQHGKTVGDIVETFERFPQLKGIIEVSTIDGFKPILEARQTAFEKPITIKTKNGKELICSRKHKLFSKNWEHTENLLGKKIETVDGKSPIISLLEMDKLQPLYDIQVADNQEYWANGIRSHNSSIIDIFVWALFGKPMKNIPADDVKNSHTKGAGHACVEFWKDDDYFEVNRYRGDREFGNGICVKKNGIVDDSFVNGTNRDVQKQIDDLLGLDYFSLTASIVFTSEVPFLFPKLTPEKRRGQLENMLGLQAYSDYGKLAKQRVKAFRRQLEDFTLEEKEKKNFLTSQRDDLENYSALHKNFSKDKERAVLILIDELECYRDLLKDINLEERNNLEVQIAKLEVRIEDIRTEIMVQNKELLEAKHTVKSAEKELADMERTFIEKKKQIYHQYKKDIKVYQDKIDLMLSECPTCGRGWAESEVRDTTAIHEAEILKIHEAVDTEVEKLTNNFNSRSNETRKDIAGMSFKLIESNIESLEDRLLKITGERRQCQITLKELPTTERVENLRFKIIDTEGKIETKKHETNPYKEVIDGLSIRINDYLEQLEKIQDNRIDVEDKLKYASFWDESFNNDGLKLFIFESILPILNSKIAFYLPMLFDGKDVKIMFDKFMNMTTIASGKSISYGGLSRGERKRVDLSIALALLDTAQAQHGMISNVMFFDEIFDSSLDGQGVRTVTEILQLMPVQTIFIMSHRLEISSEFDSVLEVEKDGSFSRIL